VKQPGELRRLAARFRAGQVWRRRDGVCFRLVSRTTFGWAVDVSNGVRPSERPGDWRFTNRHLHNLVCTERLSLVGQPTGLTIAERLRAAGLPVLARLLLGYSPSQRRFRDVQDLLEEERQLDERLRSTDRAERKQARRRLVVVREQLDSAGLQSRPIDRVMSPNDVARRRLSEPNNVSR